MIQYCLVTYDLEMVKKAIDYYPVNCFAMNPSIAVNDLKGKSITFLEASKKYRQIIGKEMPLYIEVMGDTAEEMIEDARRIVREVPGNTLVKIPATEAGLIAIKKLRSEGISSSCTAIFDLNQALLASEAGAVCVAVYVSRLDKSGYDGMAVVKEISKAFKQRGIKTLICAASLKTSKDVERAILSGAQNVTVDLHMLEDMMAHSITTR
ncbi:MAG: transaldolase family protein [Erysipelotrichaceae bacterium]|nr:transaldolase family protein [Erysipelotrichaceae bacterium]